MARLIGRIPGRQVLPGGARAQHPEDPVQDVAGIAPRPTAPIATQTRSWQERREDRPLGVGQVHAVEYDGHRNFVHSPRFGVYEIASNLPAIHGLAEIHQQMGDMPQALAYYQRVLQLAQFDPDLEDPVERLTQVISATPALTPPATVTVEELFDFDSLLQQLGETAPLAGLPEPPAVVVPSPIETVTLTAHAFDAFAGVEQQLRDRADQRAAEEKSERTDLANRRQAAVVAELEQWLAAIAVDRRAHDSV